MFTFLFVTVALVAVTPPTIALPLTYESLHRSCFGSSCESCDQYNIGSCDVSLQSGDQSGIFVNNRNAVVISAYGEVEAERSSDMNVAPYYMGRNKQTEQTPSGEDTQSSQLEKRCFGGSCLQACVECAVPHAYIHGSTPDSIVINNDNRVVIKSPSGETMMSGEPAYNTIGRTARLSFKTPPSFEQTPPPRDQMPLSSDQTPPSRDQMPLSSDQTPSSSDQTSPSDIQQASSADTQTPAAAAGASTA